jgi:predicted RNA-binding protein with PIN domain
MQVDTGWEEESPSSYGYEEEDLEAYTAENVKAVRTRDNRSFKERQMDLLAAEEELMAIFERTYGKIPERVGEEARRKTAPRTIGGESLPPRYRKPQKMPEKEYLLVDGYNIIFAWEDLRDLAQTDIKAARDRLTDILLNFAGSRREHLILVFDAYRVAGGRGEIYHFHNMDVVYTKEAETADLYIEKAAHELTRQYKVTVATSDAVEQVIIFGTGAFRMSAQMLLEEIILTQEKIRSDYTDRPEDGKNYLFDGLSEEVKKALEDLPDPG